MTRLRISRDARGDLRDIRIFSKEMFGAVSAKAYLTGLHEMFALLLTRPLIGAVQEDIAPGVRAFSHRSHRIYYRINGNDVEILRILHHAQSDARDRVA